MVFLLYGLGNDLAADLQYENSSHICHIAARMGLKYRQKFEDYNLTVLILIGKHFYQLSSWGELETNTSKLCIGGRTHYILTKMMLEMLIKR